MTRTQAVLHNPVYVLRWAVTALFVSLGVPAIAANYPIEPVKVVVPFGPNSEGDFYARLMGEGLKDIFKEANLVFENRAGESGAKAASFVKDAKPDGYTLLAGRVGSQVSAPALKPSLPYRWNDFTFLGVLQLEPLVCAVRGDAPYKDARALLAAIRAAPRTLKFAHSGSGTILNLAALQLMRASGLPPDAATGVAYTSSADVSKALANGEVDFACSNAGNFFEYAANRKVIPLFSTAPGRIPEFPNLRNAKEAGFAAMGNFTGWTGLFGPAGLPAPVVAQWKRALAQLAKSPEWKAGLEKRGAIQALGTVKDNERFIREQAVFYEQTVRALGLGE